MSVRGIGGTRYRTEQERTSQAIPRWDGRFNALLEDGRVSNGRLSIASPLACALIGKTVGDVVGVSTPKGGESCEIVDVTFVVGEDE